jgi:hypothetical protein
MVLQGALLAALICGCTTTRPRVPPNARPFNFQTDTFAYANELVWVYGYDKNGKWTSHRREPKPNYSQHCFVVVRSARQFFDNARFDTNLPVADAGTYRRLIRKVISVNPRKPLPETSKVIIPGYPNLRAFSEAHGPALKAECGGAWQSYAERGHWRMIFPLSRHHQELMADQLRLHLRESGPVIVHILRFPQLTVNHAVMLFDEKTTSSTTDFSTYDPNQPEAPVTLTYDHETRTFSFPTNAYFQGGRVDVYEIYHKWNY